MLACRAISFTAKPLRAARARMVLVHNTMTEKRMERTVLGGLATGSTLFTSRESTMCDGGGEMACEAAEARVGG